MSSPDNDFDIAKSIHELLVPLPEDRRQRILRWIAETLNVTLHTHPKTPPLPAAVNEPHEDSIRPQVETNSSAIPQSNASLDIKTFVEKKAPKNDVQFATVVAYYYRFEAPPAERSETVTTDMLLNSTRLTGRTRLASPRNTLNNAKSLGYLDGAGRGMFRINTVGENLVAVTLPSEGREKSPRKFTKRKPRTAVKKVMKKRS